jgi:hypothetical protein
MSIARLQCTVCGAEANASCNCGAHYVPATQRAKEAIEAHPEKSNRAIADLAGVDEKTIRNVRNSTADSSAVDEPRIGKDGKTRRLPTRPENIDGEISKEEFARRRFLFGARGIIEAGKDAYGFLNQVTPIPEESVRVELLETTERVISQWSNIRSLILGRVQTDLIPNPIWYAWENATSAERREFMKHFRIDGQPDQMDLSERADI